MALFPDGLAEPDHIHLGQERGHIIMQNFEEVPEVDGLCAGPPAHPGAVWALACQWEIQER
eukprot:3654235-Lingulodinium_polyedra.AAC.1